jgi:hypothetical protein
VLFEDDQEFLFQLVHRAITGPQAGAEAPAQGNGSPFQVMAGPKRADLRAGMKPPEALKPLPNETRNAARAA